MNLKQDSNKKKQSSGALLIAVGIFLSRIAGLIRERALAHYFGNSDVSDAFKAALKIPNFLQNLFGEGALSASFIPVYSELISKEENKDEKNILAKNQSVVVAKTIFYLMLITVSIICTLGIIFTPFFIDTVAPGFSGDKRNLTIKLVQILFPGTGFLVLAAWCLGVLNSHRQFFLSYFAPVIWNVTIITTLIAAGSIYFIPPNNYSEIDLVIAACVGVTIGSLLQFIIQLPKVLKYVTLSPSGLDFKNQQVKLIIKNFGPALISRGIVQISSYVDNIIASYLGTGAISGLAFSQTISTLPISLFGMSISQSELTNISRATGSSEEKEKYLVERLELSFKRLNFFIIPTVLCFVVLGDVLISTLFQTGQFTKETTHYVWTILIASSFALLGQTKSRVLSSSFYAIKDTKTPMRVAFVRVFTTTLLGIFFSIYLPTILGVSTYYQAAFLAFSFSFAASIEFFILKYLLETKLKRKINESWKQIVKLLTISLIASSLAATLRFSSTNDWNVLIRGIIILSVFGIIFSLLAFLFRIEEIHIPLKKITDKLKK